MLTIEQVLAFRLQLSRLESVESELQKVAPRRVLCELCRSGETYYLRRTFDNQIIHVTFPHVFIFVVLPSHPTQVFCVQGINKSTSDEIDSMNFPPEFILGHTSISRNNPVLYAGQLVLENDRLFAWDNFSGHYRPDSFFHEVNFLPPVKHLLPQHKMAPYEDGGAGKAYLEAAGKANEWWAKPVYAHKRR